MDINRRVVFSACEMGVGREAIAVMCEILNMPPPCTAAAWNKHSEALYDAHLKAVAEKLRAARKQVHELHKQSNPDLKDNDIIDITVSFDGTWSKKGFTANFGVDFVISAETGQVLDYDFSSKFCLSCARNKQMLTDEEFQIWYTSHKSKCTENHTGSSGAMEKKIAEVLWSRSLSYNMHYKSMVCDGDSKSYQSVWDKYGCCAECEKWENMDKKVHCTKS